MLDLEVACDFHSAAITEVAFFDDHAHWPQWCLI